MSGLPPPKSPPLALSVADRTRHPILTHARGTAPFRQLEDHFRPLGDARLVPGSNIAACLQMALDGLGIACLPRAMLGTQLTSGSLMELAYPWHPDTLQFHARHNLDPAPTYVTAAAQMARVLSPQSIRFPDLLHSKKRFFLMGGLV